MDPVRVGIAVERLNTVPPLGRHWRFEFLPLEIGKGVGVCLKSFDAVFVSSPYS
jgi:hypothetical protein